MESRNTSNQGFFQRAIALLLSVLMLVSLGVSALADDSSPFMKTEDDPEDAALNQMPIYMWHRIDKQSDIPGKDKGRVPVLIIWKDGGKTYYVDGYDESDYKNQNQVSGEVMPNVPYLPDFFATDGSNKTFYTTELIGDWEMRNTGETDGDNKKATKVQFWSDKHLLYMKTRRMDSNEFNWKGNIETTDRDYFTLFTKELGGGYAGNLSDASPCKMFRNIKADADFGFYASGEHFYGQQNYTKNYKAFTMYWAEEIMVSAITADYTIREGMVMNVDDGVILKDNVTLTVMPGGVLSIEGRFYCNGNIKNYGTVLVQPDSAITSFMPKGDAENPSAGAIYCSGEELDAKSYAADIVKDKRTLISSLETETRTLIAENNALEREATQARREEQILWAEKPQALLDENENEIHEAYKVSRRSRVETLAALIEVEEEKMIAALKDADYSDAVINAKTDEELKAAGLSDGEITTFKAARQQYYDDHIATMDTERDLLKAPVEEQQSIYLTADQTVAANKAVIELNQLRITQLQKQIVPLEEIANAKEKRTMQGEGNLVIMKNGRVSFTQNKDSLLTVTSGGSCVCNGYIVHPNKMLLDDGKLVIRSDGAFMGQYKITKNLLSLSDLSVSNAGTINVAFPNMEATGSKESCMAVSGNYQIKVDGVLKYSGAAPYTTSSEEMEGLIEGSGIWLNHDSSNDFYTEFGSHVVIDDEGNVTETFPDGSVSYTKRSTGVVTEIKKDGTVIVTKKDGTSREDRPNGDYIERLADGSYKAMKITAEDGSYVMTYDLANERIVTTYTAGMGLENDKVGIRYDYEESGQYEYVYRDTNDRAMYAANNELIYTFKSNDKSSVAGTYTYWDHWEKHDSKDKVTDAEYTDGDLKGAKIETITYKYGNKDFYFDSSEYGKLGALVTKVTSSDASGNQVTTCRKLVGDSIFFHVSLYGYVWQFADGNTMTVQGEVVLAGQYYIEPEDVNPRWFLYGSNLMATPLNLDYDEHPFYLPTPETGTWTKNGTFECGYSAPGGGKAIFRGYDLYGNPVNVQKDSSQTYWKLESVTLKDGWSFRLWDGAYKYVSQWWQPEEYRDDDGPEYPELVWEVKKDGKTVVDAYQGWYKEGDRQIGGVDLTYYKSDGTKDEWTVGVYALATDKLNGAALPEYYLYYGQR